MTYDEHTSGLIKNTHWHSTTQPVTPNQKMSLMTYKALVEVVNNGWLDGADYDLINGASIDVRLGDTFLLENDPLDYKHKYVDLCDKETPSMSRITFNEDKDEPVHLHPGQFVLAETAEIFNLPDHVACEFKLKSSAARAGLNHSLAGWGDPGFNNATLTLELQNVLEYHTLLLRPGMKIGQVVFWQGKSVPTQHSYATKGRYNNQRGPTESKGV